MAHGVALNKVAKLTNELRIKYSAGRTPQDVLQNPTKGFWLFLEPVEMQEQFENVYKGKQKYLMS